MPTKPPKPIRKLLPKEGWNVTATADLVPLGEYPAECERCGRELRYAHVLEHDDWEEPIIVGRCCAKRLTTGYDPADAERLLINLACRRKRYLELDKWQESYKGNPWREYGGATITIFPKEGGYAYCVALPKGERHFVHGFDTVRKAKLAAFDLLQELSY